MQRASHKVGIPESLPLTHSSLAAAGYSQINFPSWKALPGERKLAGLAGEEGDDSSHPTLQGGGRAASAIGVHAWLKVLERHWLVFQPSLMVKGR